MLSFTLCYTMREVDHSNEGFIWQVRLYCTDLDIVFRLHVPEERPYVLQCLLGVFALQPKIRGPISNEIIKVMNTQKQR